MSNCSKQETTNTTVEKKKINKWYLDSRWDAVAEITDLPKWLEVEDFQDVLRTLSQTNYGRQKNAVERLEDCELKKLYETLAAFHIVKVHCRTTGDMWFLGYPETTFNAVTLAKWMWLGARGDYRVFTTDPSTIPEDLVGDIFTKEDDLVRLFVPMAVEPKDKDDVVRIQSIISYFEQLELKAAEEDAKPEGQGEQKGQQDRLKKNNGGRGPIPNTAVAHALRNAGAV